MQDRTRNKQTHGPRDSGPSETVGESQIRPNEQDLTLIGTTAETNQKLDLAMQTWSRTGRTGPLTRWFQREVDSEGMPRYSRLNHWEFIAGIETILANFPKSPLPEDVREPLRSLFLFSLSHAAEELRQSALLPSGAAILRLSQRIQAPEIEHLVKQAQATKNSGSKSAATFVGLFGNFNHATRPLATLRNQQSGPITSLRIDHSRATSETRFNFEVGGRHWLGPEWSFESQIVPDPLTSATRWRERSSTDTTDYLEWTFKNGPVRVIRSVLLLKQFGLALLADEVHGATHPITSRVDLGTLVQPESESETRGLKLLHTGESQLSAWPLALPTLPYQTDRGSFSTQGSKIQLIQKPDAKRIWMPMLFSWNPVRNRRPISWRILTVSESFKKCKPGTAFAVRIGFKGLPSLVFYRSLATPTRRAMLGYQTTARMMAGEFHTDGKMTPLFELE